MNTLDQAYPPIPIKVCIFDIDNTLTHGADANAQTCRNLRFHNDPSPAWPNGSGTTNEVKNIVQRCVDNGYQIAIASAESEEESVNDTQIKFLESINPVFDARFFKSPRYQRSCTGLKMKPYCTTNEYSDKTAMYQNIMRHYGVPPTEWKNSIVFDDDYVNIETANRMGFRYCQASQGCSGKYCSTGCGVRNDCESIL